MLAPRHLRRHGGGLIQLYAGPRTPLPLVLGVISLPSASSAPSTSRQSSSYVATRRVKPDIKGKGRAVDIAYPLSLASRRAFHATARRQAIPLLPATIAILKGTSLLTLATAISRVIISFLPIGAIGAVRMMKLGKWLDSDDTKPIAGPEAEDFWRMWCEDEKGVSISKEEGLRLTDAKMDDNCCLISEDGRIAYHIRMLAVEARKGRKGDWPHNHRLRASDLVGRPNWKKTNTARMISRHYYYLPPLPPASIPYYEELTAAQKGEVDALRRYWIGLKMFKRYFKGWHIAFAVLLGFPIVLLAAVYAAGLERVPLTGRWRLILLTPEEEDAISTSLAGPNWYRSVINLLTTPERPAPRVLQESDWRWHWVQGVLNRLEQATLANYGPLAGATPPIPEYTPSIPVPPPPYHPLNPRPRVSSMLHSVLPGGEPTTGREHLELGPPYNLMLMEKDERNAFSYGFGGKRAGGIVVFTGLLDSILADGPPPSPVQAQPPPARAGFFAGLFSSAPPTRPARPQPTEEQSLHLACVLAHEMGHLLLSHHLETLSQQQVLWPSMLGLGMDLIRAFIWPITWILGPAVNDALANMGRTSTAELADRYGEIGFQWKHEYEADLAGMRLMALAGFDPSVAVDYFSRSVADLHEIQPTDKEKENASLTSRLFKLWTEATHPSPDQRREAVRTELERWRQEAKKTEDAGDIKP